MFDAIHQTTREACAANQALLELIAAGAGPGDDAEDHCSSGADHDHAEGTVAPTSHTHDHHSHAACAEHSAGVRPVLAAAAAGPVGPTSSYSYYSKVCSTLHQFVRDWSTEGESERAQCYGPLLSELQARFPLAPADRWGPRGAFARCTVLTMCVFGWGGVHLCRKGVKVLVPGAGLGRLVFDVVRLGVWPRTTFAFQNQMYTL